MTFQQNRQKTKNAYINTNYPHSLPGMSPINEELGEGYDRQLEL